MRVVVLSKTAACALRVIESRRTLAVQEGWGVLEGNAHVAGFGLVLLLGSWRQTTRLSVARIIEFFSVPNLRFRSYVDPYSVQRLSSALRSNGSVRSARQTLMEVYVRVHVGEVRFSRRHCDYQRSVEMGLSEEIAVVATPYTRWPRDVPRSYTRTCDLRTTRPWPGSIFSVHK